MKPDERRFLSDCIFYAEEWGGAYHGLGDFIRNYRMNGKRKSHILSKWWAFYDYGVCDDLGWFSDMDKARERLLS